MEVTKQSQINEYQSTLTEQQKPTKRIKQKKWIRVQNEDVRIKEEDSDESRQEETNLKINNKLCS